MKKLLVKPVRQIISKYIAFTLENEPKRPIQQKTYDQVNWL